MAVVGLIWPRPPEEMAVQLPVPVEGMVAARVAVPGKQIVWAGPASAVEGAGTTVTLVLSVSTVPHQFVAVSVYVPVAAPVTVGSSTVVLLKVPVPVQA